MNAARSETTNAQNINCVMLQNERSHPGSHRLKRKLIMKKLVIWILLCPLCTKDQYISLIQTFEMKTRKNNICVRTRSIYIFPFHSIHNAVVHPHDGWKRFHECKHELHQRIIFLSKQRTQTMPL